MDQPRIIQKGTGQDGAQWAEALADPAWRDRAEVLKEDGDVRVLRVEMLGQMVVIKQWNVSRFKRRVQGVLKGTPAWRHWRGALRLKKEGVRTAEPIALFRCIVEGVKLEILVMEALDGKSLLEHLAAGDLSVRQEHVLARAIASQLNTLMNARIRNRDHKPSNLIVTHIDDNEACVAIIDCVGIKRDGFISDEPEYMLTSLVLEPTGCKCPPRRTLMMRVLWSLNSEVSSEYSREVRRDDWETVSCLVQTHGDPTPKINPLIQNPS